MKSDSDPALYIKNTRRAALTKRQTKEYYLEDAHQGHLFLHALPDGLNAEAGEDLANIVRRRPHRVHISLSQYLKHTQIVPTSFQIVICLTSDPTTINQFSDNKF